MGWLRLIVRLTAFVLFLLATVTLAIVLLISDAITRRKIDRTPWAKRCFRVGCRTLGLRIHVHGAPDQENALFVSNHISWSDIPILGSLTPVRFLSKAEVGQWPVIGWLAQQAGTLFIKRGGGKARQIRRTISEHLTDGESVLIFPEGTTSSGLSVLPFHGLLLGAAADARTAIQPVTISYRRDGRPDHLAPFIGDDDFHTHMFAMLRQPSARVDVVFHAPVHAPAGIDKAERSTSELSAQLHETVLAGLKRIHDGEFDHEPKPVRIADDPELSHPQ
ncbi:1-acyl-sn-glycerol-3-phosphate acyltransferase [Marinobacter salinexigens]|uniref:1-acyl-sn-glycerol-3-phosphate acyltransferase n=1 Tax=Marinobacter salinexigens TaxID=2919747 RepID=A0A5B0VBT3_9GAMM|nr:lysophospholipid acyltransferase family protein [Marinobacter salinexigens]KAA1172037.1 1-acyl-sn-glycerol-3-phosphate acyltransferase [Marinobacter salinexigens]